MVSFYFSTSICYIQRMIKGFLFDYDGVMTKNSDANIPPSERLANILNWPVEETNALFMSFWPNYLRGKITDDELWDFLEDKTDKFIPSDQRRIWSTWEQLRPLPEMVDLVQSLRKKEYPVGLLTNVTPTTLEEVKRRGGYKGFNFLVQSCRVGYAKPDTEVYHLAMERFENLDPEEVVFIDDRERFLAPARAIGMKTILSLNSQQVIDDVRQILTSEEQGIAKQ